MNIRKPHLQELSFQEKINRNLRPFKAFFFKAFSKAFSGILRCRFPGHGWVGRTPRRKKYVLHPKLAAPPSPSVGCNRFPVTCSWPPHSPRVKQALPAAYRPHGFQSLDFVTAWSLCVPWLSRVALLVCEPSRGCSSITPRPEGNPWVCSSKRKSQERPGTGTETGC